MPRPDPKCEPQSDAAKENASPETSELAKKINLWATQRFVFMSGYGYDF